METIMNYLYFMPQNNEELSKCIEQARKEISNYSDYQKDVLYRKMIIFEQFVNFVKNEL